MCGLPKKSCRAQKPRNCTRLRKRIWCVYEISIGFGACPKIFVEPKCEESALVCESGFGVFVGYRSGVRLAQKMLQRPKVEKLHWSAKTDFVYLRDIDRVCGLPKKCCRVQRPRNCIGLRKLIWCVYEISIGFGACPKILQSPNAKNLH